VCERERERERKRGKPGGERSREERGGEGEEGGEAAHNIVEVHTAAPCCESLLEGSLSFRL